MFNVYLFITLNHTQIRVLKVCLSDDNVVEDDHVLSDESSDRNEWDEEHRAHVDQLSGFNNFLLTFKLNKR